MSQVEQMSLGERCRALAQKCRTKARSFRNEKPRTQMLQLAAGYEHKARLAEDYEASLRALNDLTATLVPEQIDSLQES